ncbi:MAG: hypothetical protein KDE34_00885 [Anaerolineales bacterium]|nr:hypothetical protein [Anaerolineales bacterium]
MLLDVDRGELVVTDQLLADQNGVLVVATFPAQESDHHILAQRQLTTTSRGAVSQDLANAHLLTAHHNWLLVNTGALVGALILAQGVVQRAILADNDDGIASHADHFTILTGNHNLTGVQRRLFFHTRADNRHIRPQQRHCLTLHVGTHQGPVRVIMLQERNQGGGDTHDLPGRYVHKVNALGIGENKLLITAGRDTSLRKLAPAVQTGIRLGDGEMVFFISRHVDDFVRHKRLDIHFFHTRSFDRLDVLLRHSLTRFDNRLTGLRVDDIFSDVMADQCFIIYRKAMDNAAVWRLDETITVHPTVSGQPADQTDVRSFRRLNGADTAVMAMMDVTNLKARPLPAQTART